MQDHPFPISILLSVVLLSCMSKNIPLAEDELQSPVMQEERIEFVSEDETIVGYLSKPENVKTFPVIVVLHSASHGHHENALYDHLERHMNDIGVGVFTYDRRGSGASGGDFNTASLELLAKDALSAIHALKLRKDIAKDKIGLFGISQGGWLAPLAYSIDPSDISFMILLSSSGVSPAKQMEYSAVTTLKMNNYPESVISIAKHLRNITNEYYRGKRDRRTTQNEIDRYREEPWFADVYLPWRGNLPEDVSVTKWIHEMDFNPEVYFEHIDIPVILFYGATDRWVPIEESIAVWNRVFEKNGNIDHKIFRVKRAGHMMVIDEDLQPEREVIADQYIHELKTWLNQHIQ